MDEDDGVHRLEGSDSKVQGGLILMKNKPEDSFKVPKRSLLGLDKLAEKRRKETEEARRLVSFEVLDFDGTRKGGGATPNREFTFKTPDSSSFQKASRQIRERKDETPTYTGGVSDLARDRLREHINRERDKGFHYTTKDTHHNEKYDSTGKSSSSHRDNDYSVVKPRRKRRDRRRERDGRESRRDFRDRRRSERYNHESDSSRSICTPRFKDEPQSPNCSIANSSWDDEEGDRQSHKKKSSWDFPTPKSYENEHSDWSTRSSSGFGSASHSDKSSRRRKKYDENTPRATPAYNYNSWANDRKKSGATPSNQSSRQPWGQSKEDRDLWEEEQRRLDREWYNIDEGYDDENNPFNSANADYFK